MGFLPSAAGTHAWSLEVLYLPMSHSLNPLKGGLYKGLYRGLLYIGDSQGDTRSIDYSSMAFRSGASCAETR